MEKQTNKSTAAKQTAGASEPKRVKVIITPRDDGETFGYVGFNGYTAKFQFDEEIEMPVDVVEFLKTRGGYKYDTKGGKPKWLSRYIIEKV